MESKKKKNELSGKQIELKKPLKKKITIIPSDEIKQLNEVNFRKFKNS